MFGLFYGPAGWVLSGVVAGFTLAKASSRDKGTKVTVQQSAPPKKRKGKK